MHFVSKQRVSLKHDDVIARNSRRRRRCGRMVRKHEEC